MAENFFANFAAQREKEQREIEAVNRGEKIDKPAAEPVVAEPEITAEPEGEEAEKPKSRAGRPRKKEKKVPLGLKISEKTKDEMKIMAIRKKCTVSELVENMYFECYKDRR